MKRFVITAISICLIFGNTIAVEFEKDSFKTSKGDLDISFIGMEL